MINDEHLRKLTNKVEDAEELYQRHVLYTRLSVATTLISILTIIMTVALVPIETSPLSSLFLVPA